MKNTAITIGLCLGSSGALAMQIDPCEPTQIAEIELSSGNPAFLASSASVGLVVQGNGEIMIFDISGGTLDRVGEITRPNVSEIVFYNDVAFMIDDDGTQVEMIDFADPASANVLGVLNFKSGVFDIAIDGSMLFVALGPGGMEMLDVSEPTNVQVVGSIHDEDIDHVSASAGKLMAAVPGPNNRRIRAVYDVTDPANITLFADSVPFGFLVNDVIVDDFSEGRVIWGFDGSELNVQWDGEYATNYASSRANDVIWRVTASHGDQSPVRTSLGAAGFHADGFPYSSNLGNWFLGIDQGVVIVGPSDVGAIAASDSGLWLIDIDDGIISQQPLVAGRAVFGDEGLIIASRLGLQRYDLGDPSNPLLVASGGDFAIHGYSVSDLVLSAGFVFANVGINDGFTFPSGLFIYDAITLEKVSFSESIYRNSQRSAAVHGNRFAIGVNGEGGYFEINAAGETVALGNTSAISFRHRVAMHGDLLVSLNSSGDIKVFDLADPTSIIQVGVLDDATVSNQDILMISQNMAVVTDQPDVQFIDLADPANPVEVARIDHTGSGPIKIDFSDGLLSVSRVIDSVDNYFVYDVSNVNNIQLVEEFQDDGWGGIDGLAIHGSKRVVAGRTVRVFESCYTPCDADFTGDGVIDFFDVDVFLQAFANEDPIADLTGEGIFDFFDVSAFLQAFAAGCP